VLVTGGTTWTVVAPATATAASSTTWQVVAPRILNPTGVAVDAAGDFFVDEPSFQGVEEVTPAGATTILDPSIAIPDALFATDSGVVYVADDATGTIYEITTNDSVSAVTSAPNPSQGRISQIAVTTGGKIWFTQDSTVWEADPGGTATASGIAGGSIAADNLGYAYVSTSTALDRVAPDGSITELPSAGSGYINADAAGDIYSNNPSGPGGVHYDGLSFPLPADAAWNVAPNGDVVEAGTSWLDRTTKSMATSYVATQELTQGLSLITAPDGNVQVGGSTNLEPCQVEVSPSGAESPAATSAGPTENCGGDGPVAGGRSTPSDPWSTEYYYDSSQGLTAFTESESGGFDTVQTFGPEGQGFTSLASNGTSDVWGWTTLGGGTVDEVSFPAGTVTDVASIPNVTALAVDAVGDVYAAYDGGDLKEIPVGGGASTTLSTSLVNTQGLTVDASGHLWVADSGGNQVLEDVGGVLTQVGPALPDPTSIAFDSLGNLYVLTADGVMELVPAASVPPGVPYDVVASAGDQSALVSWSAPTSDGGETITGYTVTASPGGATCAWTTGALSCTVTGLTNGTHYTFTVTATNGQGTGPASSPSAAVTPATIPGSPTGVEGTPGYGIATATWVAPVSDGGSAITGYMATASPGGNWCAWTSGPLACTITGLTDGDSYTITVTATNGAGTSPPSDPSPFVTPAGLPGSPTIATAVAGNDDAVVSWGPPSLPGEAIGITSYTATSSTGGKTCSWSTGPLTCIVAGLANGTAYTFTVTATNFDGTGPSSTPTSSVTPATTPTAPSAVGAVGANASIDVTWSAPTSDGGSAVTGYTATASPGGRSCTWSSGPLDCTVTGLTDGTAYTFTVTATNAKGTGPMSASSAPVTPSAATAPGAPTAVRTTPGTGSVTMSWSAPATDGGSSITSYTVTASPGGRTCSTSSTSCAIGGLGRMTSYTFSVVARNAVGAGPASATPGTYAFDPVSLGIEVTTTVVSRNVPFTIIVGGAGPGSMVTLSAPHAKASSCKASSVGQCAAVLTLPSTGQLVLRATDGESAATLTIWAPLVTAARSVKHGDVWTITVSSCPGGARVVVFLSDGRTYAAKASAHGSAAFRLTMPVAGSVRAHVKVNATELAATSTVTVT